MMEISVGVDFSVGSVAWVLSAPADNTLLDLHNSS